MSLLVVMVGACLGELLKELHLMFFFDAVKLAEFVELCHE